MIILGTGGYALSDGTVAHISHQGLWRTGGTVTASSTATGYDADNADTLYTYERWSPASLPATWEYDFGTSRNFDCVVIGAHTMGTNGNTLQIQRYDSGAWTNIATQTNITSDAPIMAFFTLATDTRFRIRITNGTPPTIGIIKASRFLKMERPMYGGHSPLDLSRRPILQQNNSGTGEWLGRSRIGSMFATSFAWDYMTADWVRTNWPGFQEAIEIAPFFIAWRPSSFDEVGLCYCNEAPIPSNMGVKDYMSVSMNVEAYRHE